MFEKVCFRNVLGFRFYWYHLSICLSIYLSTYLSIYLSIYLELPFRKDYVQLCSPRERKVWPAQPVNTRIAVTKHTSKNTYWYVTFVSPTGTVPSSVQISWTIWDIKWVSSWQKTPKWHVRPAKTQVSLGIRPVFAVHIKKARVLSYPLSAQRRLIRPGGCPCWSEFSLCAHTILFVLTWGSSLVIYDLVLFINGPETRDLPFAVYVQGDNCCCFLFAVLHAKSLLKRDLP